MFRVQCSIRWVVTLKRKRHYASALKIVPDEPSVLSNLGLSYLLTKDLKNAEETLRRAVAQPNAEPQGPPEPRVGGWAAWPL